MIDPTLECVVVQRAAAPIQPSQQAGTRILHQLELHRLACLRLYDDCAAADLPSQYQITNPDLDHVATAELAVDRQVEQRPVTQAPVLVKEEADSPNLSRLQRALRSNLPSGIPDPAARINRVKF